MRFRDAFSQHMRQVGALSSPRGGELLVPGQDRIAESWRRSMEQHRVDPEMPASPRILSAAEVRERCGRIEPFLQLARLGVGKLHSQIKDAGYCVLMTDAEGSTVDFRGQPSVDHEFRSRGFRVGACWSERDEGTCGVGTTLIDRAPILVHKGEHFRAYNIGITCSAAPVFGPDNDVVAVINASALASPDDRRSQSVVFQLVAQNARFIENAWFIEANRHRWTVQIAGVGRGLDPERSYLLALDERGRIVQANFLAHVELLEYAGPLPRAFHEVFDLSADELLRAAHDRPGMPVGLRRLSSGHVLSAVVRVPEQRRQPRRVVQGRHDFSTLAAGDTRIASDIQRLKRIVNSRLPILLLGETGAGKEAFAHAIHAQSERRDQPFVALNCAAIPENLIESELFGYREGAFTGAKAKGEAGKIQLSSGGTLFLDEIGDMPLPLQTRLLRVLAEGEVLRLGGTEPEKVDLNVVCATHRDLEALVAAGRFREDLYYRLNAATFTLPPLRARSDRRQVLQQVFDEECAAAGRDIALPDELADELMSYAWPGNIRQLRNTLRYAVAVCESDVLSRLHLPDNLLRALDQPAPSTAEPRSEAEADERRRIIEAMEASGWRATEAAALIGMPRATFYRRLSRYGLGRGRFPSR
ncbi:sigma-54-dependent Fis family transcriptional regulator [Methyloversatilis universalis]|uniref:sigma-54-dependent Fis family transcriptional regulator n=1 Tax=Methyloversatilis universalis TaxID=378211 RepID=UPI00036316A5|nr:sigma-54-dependent Fis family transcriptional regulator [Methyloversatilis universalis]